ncbi:tyrosine-protein phosphatase [Microbacterium sp. Bi128]|uniref:tyrosine-protein phosphatase n=1 Tax=Microbacterium sp. Bi128 TaxID=2821115 RepID=UPI001DFACC2C|nr:tyrosine-protein phosphatase [Microbacterium sp. Bi128]CAH0217753.1 Tyrosine-protein phosphatase [Microbacterium sp. Bi128]
MSTLVSGATNFRDVGGLSAGSGRTRSGVLFRSGNLRHVDDEGLEALRALGLRRIVDLRDDDEVRHAPSRLTGLDVDVQRLPLFLGSVESFFERDISLGELYDELISDSPTRIVAAVRAIAGAQPVLIHCTVGKDRTGVTVAIALAAAGVDRDAVVADYARTESLLPAERNRLIVSGIRALHPENRHAEELATRSPAPVMRALLERLDAEHGSPAGFLRAHGVTDDELAGLRDALVE